MCSSRPSARLHIAQRSSLIAAWMLDTLASPESYLLSSTTDIQHGSVSTATTADFRKLRCPPTFFNAHLPYSARMLASIMGVRNHDVTDTAYSGTSLSDREIVFFLLFFASRCSISSISQAV